jgi:hypothetical protein
LDDRNASAEVMNHGRFNNKENTLADDQTAGQALVHLVIAPRMVVGLLSRI